MPFSEMVVCSWYCSSTDGIRIIHSCKCAQNCQLAAATRFHVLLDIRCMKWQWVCNSLGPRLNLLKYYRGYIDLQCQIVKIILWEHMVEKRGSTFLLVEVWCTPSCLFQFLLLVNRLWFEFSLQCQLTLNRPVKLVFLLYSGRYHIAH